MEATHENISQNPAMQWILDSMIQYPTNQLDNLDHKIWKEEFLPSMTKRVGHTKGDHEVVAHLKL